MDVQNSDENGKKKDANQRLKSVDVATANAISKWRDFANKAKAGGVFHDRDIVRLAVKNLNAEIIRAEVEKRKKDRKIKALRAFEKEWGPVSSIDSSENDQEVSE